MLSQIFSTNSMHANNKIEGFESIDFLSVTVWGKRKDGDPKITNVQTKKVMRKW